MSRKQKRVFLSLLILVGLALSSVVFVSARSKITAPPLPKSGEIKVSNTAQSASTVPRLGRVQVVRFTLYDAGIYPNSARAQQGLVAILIEDLSGTSSGVVVELSEGNIRAQVGKVDRVKNQLRGRGEILMTAGRYEVYDANRPDNRAVLIVDP